ncbi:one cut domain family member 3-like [Hetaerina americana]|uniref:one cut domain family member 3-like n=1 Tax=Hetaerina americana TaxID=62018 RepID=UPI003A7F10BB
MNHFEKYVQESPLLKCSHKAQCRGGGSRGGSGVVAVGGAVAGAGGGGNGGGGGGGGAHYASDEDGPPKSCCGLSAAGVGGSGQPASVRWFVLAIAFVGVCCALVGTVLGALKATGREHLTVSLLMIGVGIVLITVSGVAWRLTSHDAPSCRMMLGLGGSDEGAAPNRRFVPRLPPSYGRPHHPYAAMMYPEFQYRPPPPSYQASMQEYRLRLLLLDRHPGGNGAGGPTMGVPGGVVGAAHMPPITSNPHPPPPMLAPPNQPHPHHLHAISPPPTYRSYAGSTIREWRCRAGLGLRRGVVDPQDHSRPPSYRSRASSSARPTLDPAGGVTNGSVGQHSRDGSLSLSYLSANSHEADAGPDGVRGVGGGVNPCDVSVINVNSSSLPSSPLPDNLVLMMVTGGGGEADMEEKKLAMGEGEGVEVVVEGDGGTLLHRLCGGGDRKRPGPATVVLEDTHVVTIVQTTDAAETGNGGVTPQSAPESTPGQGRQQGHRPGSQGEAVIVTVSGSTPGAPQNPGEGGEMEILAHL